MVCTACALRLSMRSNGDGAKEGRKEGRMTVHDDSLGHCCAVPLLSREASWESSILSRKGMDLVEMGLWFVT